MQPQDETILLCGVEMGRDLIAGRQAGKNGNILQGCLRLGAVAIACRKCRRIGFFARPIHAGLLHGMDKNIAPASRSIHDFGFQCRHIWLRCRAFVARDHIMHAHQRAFTKLRLEEADVATKFPLQQHTDFLTQFGIETIPRQKNESGDKSVKPIPAHKNARARTLLKAQNSRSDLFQLRARNLQEFIARECFQHIGERFSRMAIRLEATGLHHSGNLAPNERNFLRALRIGR